MTSSHASEPLGSANPGDGATPPRGCYLYLAAHLVDRRFKIGISQEPLQRLAALPDAPKIDYGRSLQVWLPSSERARDLELGLHRLLRPWNQREHCAGQGYTEWFHTDVWAHAISLAEAVPLTRREPLDGRLESVLRGAVTDLHPVGEPRPEPPLRSMTRTLYEVAEHCLVQTVRIRGPHRQQGEFCGLRVWDLRQAYAGPMHSLRYQLMDPQAYEVDSSAGPRSLLAGPIQWARQRPADLWIPLRPPSHWRRHEELAHLGAALRGVARRLDALAGRWHKLERLIPAVADVQASEIGASEGQGRSGHDAT